MNNKVEKFSKYIFISICNYLENVNQQKSNLKIHVKPKFIKFYMFFLKLNSFSKINLLTDIFGVDNLQNIFRFSIYYQTISISFKIRIESICKINLNFTGINSISKCFNS